MNPFCLRLVFLCWSLVNSFELSNFTLNFRLKILTNLTAKLKTRGRTKPDNEIINTISHHGNWIIMFTNPSARAGYDTRSIFKQSLTGLNSVFSFSMTSCHTNAEELSLSYYLPIAGGRIIGFIPSPRVLVQCEMQSVSSRVWTRVAVPISYDDNHFSTGTSFFCPTPPLEQDMTQGQFLSGV